MYSKINNSCLNLICLKVCLISCRWSVSLYVCVNWDYLTHNIIISMFFLNVVLIQYNHFRTTTKQKLCFFIIFNCQGFFINVVLNYLSIKIISFQNKSKKQKKIIFFVIVFLLYLYLQLFLCEILSSQHIGAMIINLFSIIVTEIIN